jgi:hypothetical protein
MNGQRELTKSDGAAAAASLAAAIGVLVMGLLTTLAEISSSLKAALAWYNPAGPLSGKTGLGVIVWLILWIVLHMAWRDKDVNFGSIYFWSLTAIVLAWIFTFPPVFEFFTH